MTEGLTRREKYEDRYRELWFTMRDIADILNITPALVAAAKDRFDLPRAEEESTDPEGI